jgi:biotin carboxylase
MKKIMILGAGEMQVPIIKKTKDRGLYTIVADMDAAAPGAAMGDLFLKISTIDSQAVLEAAKHYRIDGILTTSDYPVNVVAAVCQNMGLNGMSKEIAAICTNKFLQRQFFSEHDIKTPFFQLLSEGEDLNRSYDFPLIIKPVDSSASRGVKKVSDMDELRLQYAKTMQFSKKGQVIIEGFIEGREFSVETLTQDHESVVVAITEKLLENEHSDYFVEDTHIIPARISTEEYGLIETTVLEVLHKLGINNCPTHTEIKINQSGAYIIEIACRLGGDFIASDLVPLATGIDMLDNLINLSLGLPVDIEKKQAKTSCIQFLNTDNFDRIVDLISEGSSYIIKSEVKHFHDKPIESSFDRMGYVIMQTETTEQMNQLLSRIQ